MQTRPYLTLLHNVIGRSLSPVDVNSPFSYLQKSPESSLVLVPSYILKLGLAGKHELVLCPLALEAGGGGHSIL